MRTANIAIVFVFLTVISLPLAANIAGFDGADPAAENRELATFPHLGASWRSISAFGPGLGLWFEDHFGFRSLLVRWYGRSRLDLLGVSPSAAVVKGRDGWFFYGDDRSIDDYVNDEPLSAEGAANWRDAIAGADRWLRAHGIAYVFTIAPDKYVIYPEEMPASLVRIGRTSRTDRVYEALRGSGVTSVDVRPALLDARIRERVYQRTDTHWNDRGALAAYQQIIAAVRARVPSTPPPWTCADFEPVTRVVEGMDLAGMMGLTRVLREEDLVLVPRRPRLARVIEPAGAKVQAMTIIDMLMRPELVQQAWDYFRNVQTKEQKYEPLVGPNDQPAVWMNEKTVAQYRPEMKKYYFDPTKYKTYLEQLGIKYPTLRQ